MITRWALTEKGIDTIPFMMMIATYGSKHNADLVFEDKKPRKLHELFNQDGMT